MNTTILVGLIVLVCVVFIAILMYGWKAKATQEAAVVDTPPPAAGTTPATEPSSQPSVLPDSITVDPWVPAPLPIPEDPRRALIQSKLDEAYGLYSSNPFICPYESCAYSAVKMTGGDCRSLGGVMNGTPSDTEWTTCHLNVGKKDPTSANAFRSLLPAGSCPGGVCQYGTFSTTGVACRALGGAMNGTPGDDEWTDCHLNIGESPKWALYPYNACPTGTCYDTKFPSVGVSCKAIGGVSDTDGPYWGTCQMSIGSANIE